MRFGFANAHQFYILLSSFFCLFFLTIDVQVLIAAIGANIKSPINAHMGRTWAFQEPSYVRGASRQRKIHSLQKIAVEVAEPETPS